MKAGYSIRVGQFKLRLKEMELVLDEVSLTRPRSHLLPDWRDNKVLRLKATCPLVSDVGKPHEA